MRRLSRMWARGPIIVLRAKARLENVSSFKSPPLTCISSFFCVTGWLSLLLHCTCICLHARHRRQPANPLPSCGLLKYWIGLDCWPANAAYITASDEAGTDSWTDAGLNTSGPTKIHPASCNAAFCNIDSSTFAKSWRHVFAPLRMERADGVRALTSQHGNLGVK
jgi:hypothetical protein